ncbi:glycosyltransferase family 2 protein [Pseudomonas laurylsulfatiphila]
MTSPEVAKLSVIIPCYRCASTIERSVASIASQTMLPAEVILVDDKSNDTTIDKLRQLKDLYKNDWIRIISLPVNSGPSVARNAGWDAATQDYIAFLDADDSWHEKKIELQYNWMKKNPGAALSGHLCAVSKNGELPPKSGIFSLEQLTPKKITTKQLLLSNKFQTPTVMLKREIPFRMDETRRYSEDYDLWLRIAFNHLNCYLFNAELAYLYKAAFGDSGLSANLIEIEKGEIANYNNLYRSEKINIIEFVLATTYSIAKFARRYMMVKSRKLLKAS